MASEPGSTLPVSAVCRALQWIALLVATGSIAAVLLTVALRITYPYELEWMEGGVLDHVSRIRAGQPIYVQPGFRFVPFLYPPLYYYLSSWMMRLTGEGFVGPRLVSMLGSSACALLIYLFVLRETRQKLAALLAVALFAGCYWTLDGWFDLARVDNLLLPTVLGAAYLIRFGERARWYALAGVLLSCAFFTKQSALVFAAPLYLYCLVYRPRRFLVLLASSVLPCALAVVYLHCRTNGWFTYYVFVLPRQHAWAPSGCAGFWLRDLLPHVPIALAMIVLLLAARYRRWRRRAPMAFYIALGTGGFAVSWLSRLHSGGGINVIAPALAVTAVFFGLAAAYLPESVPTWSEKAKRRAKAAVLLGAIAQLLILARHPGNWIPSAADRAAGDRLVERIGAFDADVLVPTASYLARRAGKPTTAHHMALLDVLRADDGPQIKQHLLAELNRELHNPRCEAILLFLRAGWFQDTPIPNDFIFVEQLTDSPHVFRPASGAREFVPIYLFVRRDSQK